MTDKNVKISAFVTLGEAMASSTAEKLGVNNMPPDEIIEVMKMTAKAVFDPVRTYFGRRIAVTSFFRSQALNDVLNKNPAIMATKKSQHTLGEAMDINARVFGGVTNKQIFDYIRANIEFDQLIWEDGTDEDPAWVHVSFKSGEGKTNRGQVLRKQRVDGKAVYYKM
jgi:hypothetical protein